MSMSEFIDEDVFLHVMCDRDRVCAHVGPDKRQEKVLNCIALRCVTMHYIGSSDVERVHVVGIEPLHTSDR